MLNEYMDYLSAHPISEVLSGLVTVMESCLKYDFPIQSVVERFAQEIDSFHQLTEPFYVKRHFRFRYAKALYDCEKHAFSTGISDLLLAMSLAERVGNHRGLNVCCALFEHYKQYATDEQRTEYIHMMERVLENEKNSSLHRNDTRTD